MAYLEATPSKAEVLAVLKKSGRDFYQPRYETVGPNYWIMFESAFHRFARPEFRGEPYREIPLSSSGFYNAKATLEAFGFIGMGELAGEGGQRNPLFIQCADEADYLRTAGQLEKLGWQRSQDRESEPGTGVRKVTNRKDFALRGTLVLS